MRQIIFRGPAMHRITIDLVRSSITPIGLRPHRGGFLLLRGEFEFSARTGKRLMCEPCQAALAAEQGATLAVTDEPL